MTKLGAAHVNVSANPAEKVVAKLRADPANPNVQTTGCSVLEAFAKTAGNEVLIAEAGGVEAVIAALRAFPEDAAVQMQGIRTLNQLIAPEEPSYRCRRGGDLHGFLRRQRDSR